MSATLGRHKMAAHHTCNGSALDTGDLLGSGTISASSAEALGSLLAFTRRGADPVTIAVSQEQRAVLQDGDEVSFRGCCSREGYVSTGWGHCTNTVMTASE